MIKLVTIRFVKMCYGYMTMQKINTMIEAQTIYNWLMGIIDSSTNDFHFEGIDNLIELFKLKFPNDQQFYNLLIDIRQKRWNSIHVILT